MKNALIRDKQGFSLIEVLVAATVLTAGVLSLAQLLAMAVSANAAAGRATRAALLAAQKVEDLQAQPWESLERDTGEVVDRLDSDDAGFTRRWSVHPLPSDPANARVIQVVVRMQRDGVRIVTVRARTAP